MTGCPASVAQGLLCELLGNVDVVARQARDVRLAPRTRKSGCEERVDYSARKDSTGSSFDARRAGSTPAASPIRAASATASTA